MCVLDVELIDKPGALAQVTGIMAEQGGNVTSVQHERINEATPVNSCFVRVTLETRNYEHIEQIKKALSENGFKVR
jgi:threonine dehydratase